MLHRIDQVDDICIKNSLRVGEMDKRITLLQYKHNDPSLDPQNPHKSRNQLAMPILWRAEETPV